MSATSHTSGTAIGQTATGALADGAGLTAGCACVALLVAVLNRPG